MRKALHLKLCTVRHMLLQQRVRGELQLTPGDKCNRLIYVTTWVLEQVADWGIRVTPELIYESR